MKSCLQPHFRLVLCKACICIGPNSFHSRFLALRFGAHGFRAYAKVCKSPAWQPWELCCHFCHFSTIVPGCLRCSNGIGGAVRWVQTGNMSMMLLTVYTLPHCVHTAGTVTTCCLHQLAWQHLRQPGTNVETAWEPVFAILRSERLRQSLWAQGCSNPPSNILSRPMCATHSCWQHETSYHDLNTCSCWHHPNKRLWPSHMQAVSRLHVCWSLVWVIDRYKW